LFGLVYLLYLTNTQTISKLLCFFPDES